MLENDRWNVYMTTIRSAKLRQINGLLLGRERSVGMTPAILWRMVWIMPGNDRWNVFMATIRSAKLRQIIGLWLARERSVGNVTIFGSGPIHVGQSLADVPPRPFPNRYVDFPQRIDAVPTTIMPGNPHRADIIPTSTCYLGHYRTIITQYPMIITRYRTTIALHDIVQ